MDSLPLTVLGFAVGTALLTWLLVRQLIRLAPRIGLLDRPNERSSHTKVTPRGGGIGFVIAIGLGVAVYAAVARSGVRENEGGGGHEMLTRSATGEMAEGGGQRTEDDAFMLAPRSSLLAPSPITAQQLLTLLAAALFIAAISLRDDFKSLGAGLRFACHFAAAGAAVGVLDPLLQFDLPLLGAWTLPEGLGIAVTLLWIVGLTNVYNFMDGIDGIAGIQGVVAGGAWLLVGCVGQAPTTAVLGAVLAGGCLGFLGHNWSPAKIFMGDVGSAFLGFLFAVVPLVAVRELPGAAGFWPIFAGLAVWPFVGDGVLTFVRRLRKGEKVWEAHRSHLYQRLTQTGWSHARVSALYGAWAVVTVALAWLWWRGAPGAAWAVLLLPPVSLAALFAFVSRRERDARRASGR